MAPFLDRNRFQFSMHLLPVFVAGWLALNVNAEVGDNITIAVSNASGSTLIDVPLADGEWNAQTRRWTWNLAAPMQLFDDLSHAWLGTVHQGSVQISELNREVKLNLAVTAGTTDTVFIINSPMLDFPRIGEDVAEAKATATFSLTDTDSQGGSARLFGYGSSGIGAFQACFNGDDAMFTSLIGYMFVSNGGTADATQSDPRFGYRLMENSPTDMRSRIAFLLTADDEVSATTTYKVNGPAIVVGDANCDGSLDGGDIESFLLALSDPNDYQGEYPDCDLGVVDINGDQSIDGGDIEMFFDCLYGNCE